jgi:hypothetical protein
MSETASILVLTETSDRWFGTPEILGELLRIEGINDVDAAPLETVTEDMLKDRYLVVIGPSDPAGDIVELLLAHVESGMGLICLAPGEAFAAKLGLEPRLTGMMHPRMTVPLPGYPESGIPIKGWAQQYQPASNFEMLCPLLNPDGTSAGSPAILESTKGNGKITVFAYDIASCVYLLRQGNPLLAGARSTGFKRMRPSDLFHDWQNPADARFPVADLHTHLFRELIHRTWPDGSVLPWLWYFPDNADTLFALTSDDDWSKREHFEDLVDSCERNNASLTFYLVRENSVMDRSWLEELSNRGFDFSIHPDLRPPIYPHWESRLTEHIQQFKEAYGRSPSSSVRNHAITWSGYIPGARIEARHGFTFDANYFSILPLAKYYMTGSGLPMPIADPSGEVLPIFQLPTQFSDETTLGGQGFEWSLDLTPEQGIELVTGLIDENAQTNHSMLCVNAHPVSFATYSAPLWDAVMAHANNANVPVCSVDHLSRFWHRRRDIRLRPVSAGQAIVNDAAYQENPDMTAMIPIGNPPSGQKTRVLGGRTFSVCPLE